MRAEIFDAETTKLPNVDPWNSKSYLCTWAAVAADTEAEDTHSLDDTASFWLFNHNTAPIGNHEQMLIDIQARVDACDILVFHNAKFDLQWMIKNGIKFDHKPVWCTMLTEFVLYGQDKLISKTLADCCARRKLPAKTDLVKQFWDNGIETDEIPVGILEEYNKNDVLITKQLFLRQIREVKKAGLSDIVFISCQVTKMLARMEYNGFVFDKEAAIEYAHQFEQEVEELQEKLCAIAKCEFKASSSTQLNAVLFGGSIKRRVKELVARQLKAGNFKLSTRWAECLVPVKGLGFTPHESTLSKKTLTYSTGRKARELLQPETAQQRDFLNVLDDIATVQKALSTILGSKKDTGLINKVCEDGKIHPEFWQISTVTGRLSSRNPNGQNFPRSGTSPIKKLIKSERGVILNADLSQIEWRIAASLSRDEVMCEEIRNGFDAHADRARTSFVEPGTDEKSPEFKAARQASKTFNFRMIYGGTAKAFYYDGKMPKFELKKYEEIVNHFYEKYEGLRKWQLANHKLATKQKYIRNDTGRILVFPEEESDKGFKYVSLTKVCNYPVQSAATDCMLVGMYMIYQKLLELNLKSVYILQVHDSVVFDCAPEEAHLVAKICRDAFCSIPELVKEFYGYEINIPITCEVTIGKDYGDKGVELKADDITPEKIEEAVKKVLDN